MGYGILDGYNRAVKTGEPVYLSPELLQVLNDSGLKGEEDQIDRLYLMFIKIQSRYLFTRIDFVRMHDTKEFKKYLQLQRL